MTHFAGLIIVHGLTNALLPELRDTNLARFPAMALNQVQRLMQFAFGAMAVRLAALARTFRQCAAKKPLTGSPLSNPGAEVAFSGGEFGTEKGCHASIIYR